MSVTVQPESLPRRRILIGDAAARIKELPDRSVDMVLTSPPYFRLRDYRIDGQLGLDRCQIHNLLIDICRFYNRGCRGNVSNAVVIRINVDDPTWQTGLAAIFHAVLIRIVELFSLDRS